MGGDAALTARVWTALAAVYVIWGSTYLAIDVAIETLPTMLMLGVRFLVAGALLYAWTGRGQARPGRADWTAATIVAGLLLVLGTGGVAFAVERVDTGTVALIVASVPLWLALLDRVFNAQRLAPAAVVGLAVGFGGIALLVGPGGGGSLVGALVPVFGSLAWAAGSLYSRRTQDARAPLFAASLQMIAGGVILVVLGAATGELRELGPVSLGSALSLAYLVVFGSLVGYTAYVWLLGKAPTSLVGTYAYVNPVVAVGLGALFLGERLSWLTTVAGAAVVVAVALIVSAPTVRGPAQSRVPTALPARGR